MGSKGGPRDVLLKSMPNLRVVGGLEGTSGGQQRAPHLYRGSRPDFLSDDEVTEFHKLGIRAIVDFRSGREYKKASGDKLLNHTYPVVKVKLPLFGKMKPGQAVETVPYEVPPAKGEISEESRRVAPQNTHHYLLDFFKPNYIWAVYNRAPLWFRIYSIIYAIYDLVMGTEFRYFVRQFAKKVLNKEGLVGQYKDMIDYSQDSICAALKLLAKRGNVPALINCAHGKDRTGIVSAMVLACLGYSKEDIAADYAKSEKELDSMKDRVYTEIVEKFHMCTSFTGAKYETMMETLLYIENNYGSIPNYLEYIGFGPSEQQQLRRNLLDY